MIVNVSYALMNFVLYAHFCCCLKCTMICSVDPFVELETFKNAILLDTRPEYFDTCQILHYRSANYDLHVNTTSSDSDHI